MKCLGAMIKKLRKEAHLTQAELSRGISSTSEISRIEHGEKEPDSFLLCALVQRLGKSMDQFEITVSGNEYQISLLRTQIQNAMLQREFDTAGRCLEKYESYSESGKAIHWQYILMTRAAIKHVRYNEYIHCTAMVKEAIALSISDVPGQFEKKYGLCLQEIHLLLFYALLRLEKGEMGEVCQLLEQLLGYIETKYTSQELKIRSYPGCCYLLARTYLLQGERERACTICERGVECLRKNGSTVFLAELLELRQEARLEVCAEKELEALAYLNRYAGYLEPEETVLKLLFQGAIRTVISSGELLRGARAALGWSQEQLSRDVCARETISNMEKGRAPNSKKLHVLLEKLGVDRRKFFGYIVAEDFGTYELVRRYIKSLLRRDKEEAEELLPKLEEALDVTIHFNWQFLQSARIIYRILWDEISNEEAIRKLKMGLCYTMPEFDGTVQRIPSQEEFLILNQLASCLMQTGREQEAVQIYESVWQQYMEYGQKSVRHIECLIYLYYNYAECLEKCGCWKEALQYGREAVQLAVQCQRGYLAVLLIRKMETISEICSTKEEKQENEQSSRYIRCLLDFFLETTVETKV